MGLPEINIAFKNQAATFQRRSTRGAIGAILLDSAENVQGAYTLTAESQIPATLSQLNRDYLTRTFTGYVNRPNKIILNVLDADAADLSAALAYFATQKCNYLIGPYDCTAIQAQAIADWIKTQRGDGLTYKAVLPHLAADCEGIINFTTDGIQVGESTYDAAAYCGRIAGMIAGTPLSISCTYAPLPEVTDITRLGKTQMNAAIDAGELILLYDGEKVKIARGVNSLVTTTEEKGNGYKKIKIVEAIDIMREDIRLLTQDSYIGKYPNTYDNKCVLITAIKDYFKTLENAAVLEEGATAVEFNMDKQIAYLQEHEVDTSAMTDQEIKEANTGTSVFLSGTVNICDTIEDVDLSMTF